MAILVLDVDGVVVLGHPEGGRWDKHLARDLGVASAALQDRFFRTHWRDIALGKTDLTEALREVWPQFGCAASVTQFVDYWFANDSALNHELLGEVAAWRAAGNSAFLATVQEHQRAEYLWRTLNLRSQFDGLFYSADLGAAKPDQAFYERAHARLWAAARDEVVFLDDAIANVEAASAFGWRARHFRDVDDLRAALAARMGLNPSHSPRD
ncbi:MAG TPA: HAD-IA family hydrolase [Rhizomicrobium sp.]|jgi:putative hydrolase of the HAD superfamily|nr:HAD-IA family hydrolase [Rhizomicrobium sp.]